MCIHKFENSNLYYIVLPLVGDNPKPQIEIIFAKLFQAALLWSLCFFKKCYPFYHKTIVQASKIIILPNFFVNDRVGQKLIVNRKFTITYVLLFLISQLSVNNLGKGTHYCIIFMLILKH